MRSEAQCWSLCSRHWNVLFRAVSFHSHGCLSQHGGVIGRNRSQYIIKKRFNGCEKDDVYPVEVEEGRLWEACVELLSGDLTCVDMSAFEGVEQNVVVQGILKYLHNARNVDKVVNVLLYLRHAGVLGSKALSHSEDVHAYGFLRYRLQAPEPGRDLQYSHQNVVSENNDLDLLYDKVVFMAHRSHRLGLIDAVFDMALIDGCRVSSKMVGRLASCLRDYNGEKAYHLYCHAVERGWELDAFAYKSIVINMLAGMISRCDQSVSMGFSLIAVVCVQMENSIGVFL